MRESGIDSEGMSFTATSDRKKRMVTSQLRHFAMSISPVHGDSSEAPKRHKFPEESAANQGTSITEPEAHRTTAVVEFQRRTDRWNNMDTDGGGLTARFFSPGTSDRCLRRRTPMGERNDRILERCTGVMGSCTPK